MREWLEARGNAARENVVYNTRFGLSYRLRGEYDDENVFLNRREDYDGEIPSGVLLLTAAVDVQANRLEYEIVGWSYGEECWGIQKGTIRGDPTQLSTWRELDKILDRVYHFGNGTPIKIARSFIDSGYSTAAVYEYCRANMRRGRFAIKGKGGAGLPLLYRYGNPKQTSILLTILGVDDGKQEVMSRLGISEQGDQYFHFPRDDDYLGVRGYDSVYFKQLISEHKVVRKVGGVLYTCWEPISKDTRNEALDLRVYNLAAMQSCRVNWSEQERALRNDELEEQKETVNKKKRQAWREVDLWT